MIATRLNGLIRLGLRRAVAPALAKVNAWVFLKPAMCRAWSDGDCGCEAPRSKPLGLGRKYLIVGCNRSDLCLRAPILATGEQRQQSGQNHRRHGEVLDQLWCKRSGGGSASHGQCFSARRLTAGLGLMVTNELTAARAKGAL